MKILHFVPTIDRTSGGVGAYMQLLARELGRLCELYVVTTASAHPLSMEQARVIVIPAHWPQYRRMRDAWRKLLEEIRPDVVHVNCCWLPQCAWVQRWAQQQGYKVVLTPHGMLEPWIIKHHYLTRKLPALWLYQKRAVECADCLHATAKSERVNLLKLGYNTRIAVVANGIDVEQIALKTSWQRTKNILFLSRIHVKKGIEFLLEAVAALKAQLEDYTIRIAGEGEASYIDQLRRKTRQLGIDHMIAFCGGVYGDEKWRLFRCADVFVLPTYSENFGIVVAEALACGTPVITTIGTPWQDLEEMHCGWYTEIGARPTTQALEAFLKLTEQELENMGRNGRRLVEEKYSSRRMAKEMLALYNCLLKRTPVDASFIFEK